MDTSSGVSETIGAILLVSIVAVLIAVIGIYLFSQPVPQKTPNLNFMTGTNSSKTTLYLYHNGGDTMNVGEFSVLLDGRPAGSYCVEGGGSQWSLGKNLVVPITPATMPQSVQLIYNSTGYTGGTSSCGGGGGGTALLDDASVNIVSSVTVMPDQLPYLDCSAVRNWDCADQIPDEILYSRAQAVTVSKRIAFMQWAQARGTIIGGARNHLNITVQGPNSTIHIANAANPNCDGGTLYQLSNGDKVQITFISNPDYFTVYGSAPQIWEITAGGASRMRTNIIFAANGTNILYSGRTICHAYIANYSALDSTLDVTTTTPGRVTSLIVNESHVIEGTTATVVKLVNVQPIASGLFLVTYGANTAPIYTISWADAIQFGGVNQTGLGFS
ncbi:MAG: type IV pilin N-terminal domain-containing protein [Methanoregula sp.]|nr:type IV pilin N-terminal domain-containing protein [Methanoregula sp.]